MRVGAGIWKRIQEKGQREDKEGWKERKVQEGDGGEWERARDKRRVIGRGKQPGRGMSDKGGMIGTDAAVGGG